MPDLAFSRYPLPRNRGVQEVPPKPPPPPEVAPLTGKAKDGKYRTADVQLQAYLAATKTAPFKIGYSPELNRPVLAFTDTPQLRKAVDRFKENVVRDPVTQLGIDQRERILHGESIKPLPSGDTGRSR